ncbi:ribonuclease [Clostridium botulinum]|uniref:Ribonuclease n=1 Tax=Clostridium botulinum (strain Eklund 17B / Type B) TaxID=935198 RepID=B2TIQ0_CLOBB|nr:ribonuclease domain-containing protein [Clostridium sp. ZBS4]ACD23516.1 putative ribonuclease [Clostridium botulinum B str. Eklund 17B (NRP)]MBY6977522.1 ribonuclease [Clostridium botulinum]MBY7001773.1 ribonuclease [Clostridium botulinum]MCR1275451.1 ribonuclease [Clostridium botulinum]NFD70899.1 ribonuclease [Clostridium botulinum]
MDESDEMDNIIFIDGVTKNIDDIPWITLKSLPIDEERALLDSLKHVDDGTIPNGNLSRRWAIPFRNRDGDLPSGSYREYRVAPPLGITNAGPRRIVKNIDTGEVYYTWTHYGDAGEPAFVRIR